MGDVDEGERKIKEMKNVLRIWKRKRKERTESMEKKRICEKK